MTIDAQRFIDLALSHEQRLHRLGWDVTEPQMCWAWDSSDTRAERAFANWETLTPGWSAPTRVGRYAMKPLITHWHTKPEDMMRRLAIALAYPLDNLAGKYIVAQLSTFMKMPGIIGFAYYSEGLMLSGQAQSLIDRIDAGTPIEQFESEGCVTRARGVTAVDLDHRTTWIGRTEGEPPEIINQKDSHGLMVTGTIPRALGLIVDAIRGTVPPRHELPVRYPTVDDLYQPTGSPFHEGS